MEDKRKHLIQVKLIILLWSCSLISQFVRSCDLVQFAFLKKSTWQVAGGWIYPEDISSFQPDRWLNIQFSTWKQIQILASFDVRQVLLVQLVIVAHYFFVWWMVTFSALSVHKLFVDGGAASMQCIVAWPIVTCQILGSVQGLVRVCGQVTSPNSHGGSLRTCSALTDCSWDTSFCKPGPVLNWHIVMGQTVR